MQNKKAQGFMSQDRRNDYDVTNTVQVSNPVAVRNAVNALFAETFPGTSFDKLWLAFYDFERLFTGRYPGYKGCDTTYHDMQHTLDMTLALARLVAGYERSVEPPDRLGAARAQMAIITSLFHDSGYIRHEIRDRDFTNGAEFTLYHVSRSADFLRRYLPELGLARDVGVASMIVHFTGYELDLDHIADGRSLLPREMSRPPVQRIRRWRGRRGECETGRVHRPLQVGQGPFEQDTDVLPAGHA